MNDSPFLPAFDLVNFLILLKESTQIQLMGKYQGFKNKVIYL
jgi:hypothetical protein